MNGDFQEKYFCAANSGGGFVSFYPRLVERAERVYIVKGGPGCGKSHFLREVARSAERRAKHVTYYYCSSDPTSLDAVFIGEKILLLDGTAPHALEATMPGARDDLIDLGVFWDSTRLIGQRCRIRALAEKKSRAYSIAYDCLSSAAALGRASERCLAPAVMTDKLTAAAMRSLKSLPDRSGFAQRTVLLDSFGMRGRVRFDTFYKTADEYISVNDIFGTAHLFLEALLNEAKKRGMKVTVSLDPLFPDRLDAIRFDEVGRVYETGTRSEKKINMKRFIDLAATREIRSELKELSSLKAASLAAAETALSSAASAHFGLEKIYGEVMDFAAKEEFTDNFVGKIL